jgi:hypothetical protein
MKTWHCAETHRRPATTEQILDVVATPAHRQESLAVSGYLFHCLMTGAWQGSV